MKETPTIRLIKNADVAEVLEIYKPFIASTSFTPEYDIPNLQNFSARIESIVNYYPVLVCELDHNIVGYAYANKYRLAQGHLWSVESSIYVSPGYHGKGIATELYKTLFAILKLQNLINVFAGIVMPNISSEKFHEKLGFQEVGVFKKGIYKLRTWHDVKWYQLNLSDYVDNPALPKSVTEIMNSTELISVLKANE